MKVSLPCNVTRFVAVFVLLFSFAFDSHCGSKKHISNASQKNFQNYGSISLQKIANDYGMTLRRTSEKTFKLVKNHSEFVFVDGEITFKYNGQKLFLGTAPRSSFGSVVITKLDYEKNILPFISPPSRHPNVVRRIVIDPGHGGDNFGTVSREFNVKEKDLALDIAKLLEANLLKCGYQVMLTRNSDRNVDLTRRSEIANSLRADIFISIHLNHADSSSACGAETFFIAPDDIPSFNNQKSGSNSSDYENNRYDGWNMILAYCVQSMILGSDSNIVDRGVKASRFGVLKSLHCPGILIECGFLSNRSECRRIASRMYRAKLADAITRGVLLYDENLRRVMYK